MKILVVSDTHGYTDKFDVVLEKEQPVDMLIHCGDVERDEDYIRAAAGCPVCMVAGNNDWGSDLPQEIVTEIGKYRVFITHGHRYYVPFEMDRLKAAAKERNAQIVIFGHSHMPYLQEEDGITFLNPGSISKPRQVSFEPTYAIMKLDDRGNEIFPEKFSGSFLKKFEKNL